MGLTRRPERTRHLHVLLTEEEHDKLIAIADAEKVFVSDVARQAFRKHVRSLEKAAFQAQRSASNGHPK